MNDKKPGTQARLFPPTCRIMSASYDLQTTNADNADRGDHLIPGPGMVNSE